MPIKFAKIPSFERLNELLTYNPENGELRWRFRRLGTRSDGIAGCICINKNGRQDYKIKIDGTTYTSTRIIWMLHFREDPGSLTIDHVNRDPLNNRISNLRLATAYQQNMNRRCTSPSTATRYTGLSMNSRRSNGRPRWGGWILVAGHQYSFGSAAVDSINDAPPSWLVERAARIYALRDDQYITDATLIDEINALKRVPPVATAAE